jgi:SP family general alpha glucoside:H+ symporter-like MFS transporter
MYITALGLQAVWMLTLGIMGSVPVSEETTAIGIAVMLLLANFTFKIALGPIGFTIVGEIPSGRVRAQTIVLGRICYVAGGLAVDQLIPRMINPTAWNLKAKTGFFFLGCDVVLFIYQWFRLAETRVSTRFFRPQKSERGRWSQNRTFAELDFLFSKQVPARKFKKYQIDRKSYLRWIELTEAYELSQVQGHPVQSAVEEERRNDAKIDVVERETVAGLAR